MCVIIHMSVITQEGWSALMWAARDGKTEVIVELVKAGPNVDMLDEVCQYIFVTHDVNVQNHASRLNSPLFVTHRVHVKKCFQKRSVQFCKRYLLCSLVAVFGSRVVQF